MVTQETVTSFVTGVRDFRGARGRVAVVFLALSSLSGCGPVSYAVDVSSAERMVASARSGNAAYYAPYELSLAEAELDKAHEEAANGAYEDAIHLAEVAQAYAKRALELSGSQGGEFSR